MSRLAHSILAACLLAAACGPREATPVPGPIEGIPPGAACVGVVLWPPDPSEGTFGWQAVQGARRAVEAHGGEVQVREAPTPAAIGAHMEALIKQGCAHLVSLGPVAADPAAAIADRNRGITFSVVEFSFDPALPNAHGLIFRDDQAAFLAGALAGLASRSQVVGVVAGHQAPRSRKYVNGFAQGAAETCPACRVLSAYVTADTDPAEAERAAQKQIAAGADVIFGAAGQAGQAALLYAAGQAVYVIGAETDAYLTLFEEGAAPGADWVLGSAVKRVDVAVTASVEARLRGTFAAGTLVFEASNGGIGLAPFHTPAPVVTGEAQARLAEIQAGLASGALQTGVDLATGEIEAP
jgi:basic membrane lipoprotein Med (substrate-binding protein (PBP1-ABC) superfamily)